MKFLWSFWLIGKQQTNKFLHWCSWVFTYFTIFLTVFSWKFIGEPWAFHAPTSARPHWSSANASSSCERPRKSRSYKVWYARALLLYQRSIRESKQYNSEEISWKFLGSSLKTTNVTKLSSTRKERNLRTTIIISFKNWSLLNEQKIA